MTTALPFLLDDIVESATAKREGTTADWFRANWYDQKGNKFNEQAVPWLTAPQGPCWAYDQDRFNTFWLQWAARMFKTNWALGLAQMQMQHDPCEMMLATVDESNLKSILSRWWLMMANCPPLKWEIPPTWRRAKTQVMIARSTVWGAWPRGKSKLADKSIKYGHGNEIDKWQHDSTDTEGDPLPRFMKRGAEYPDRKFVLESTPGTKGRSRVEAGRLQSTNHAYHVPCPDCGKYQKIEFDGIQWDRLENGDSDAEMARNTARYVCRHCEADILDESRSEIMNLGVWVPFGCEVDHERALIARDLPPDDDSWLIGEPAYKGTAYGSQMSVFYALFHGWGDIAAEFLGKYKRQQDFRQWWNEDRGETWEIIARKQTWETLGGRIISEVPRRIVPETHEIITIGMDKQEEFYPYVVVAWDPAQQPHVLEYGVSEDTDGLFNLLGQKWFVEGGDQYLKASASLLDSGFRPAAVHKFIHRCTQHGYPVRAARGSSTRLTSFYNQRANGPKSSNPGELVCWVDSHSTQDWMDNQLYDGPIRVFNDTLSAHQDFLEQVLNEGLVKTMDSKNQDHEEYQRIDGMVPNDYRDCLRYAFVALLLTRGRAAKPETGKPEDKQAKPHPKGNRLRKRPGGWLNRR